MEPKPGNAFAQQKANERLQALREQADNNRPNSKNSSSQPASRNAMKAARSMSEDNINKTTLQVTTTQHNEPSSADTTFAAIVSPATELENRGREMISQQRANMEAKFKRSNSRKSRLSQGVDSPEPTVKHPSAMPAPLFTRFKDIFKKKDAAASISSDLDKPLPAIIETLSTPEAKHARQVGTHIPGAYIPSPVYTDSPATATIRPGSIPFNARAQAFFPDEQSPMRARHSSAQTFETAASQYLTTGNNAMIFSSHLTTPTRQGDYATSGQPRFVQHPSMRSMAASLVDTPSPGLSVVPEVKETREEQSAAAAADAVEQTYKQRSGSSQSDPLPLGVRAGLAVRATAAAATAPAAATTTTAAEPGRRDASTQTDDGVHRDLAGVRGDLRAVAGLVRALPRDDTLAFLEGRVAAIDARTTRIEDRLDAVLAALGVGVGVGGAVFGVGRGTGMRR